MTDTMQPFFTPDNLALFWHYVKMLLGWVQPFMMIGIALTVTWALFDIILGLFTKKPKEDEDFDYEEY